MLKTTPRKREIFVSFSKIEKEKEDSTKKAKASSSSSSTLPKKQQQISPTTSQNKQQILSDAPSPGSSFLSNTTTTKNEKSANNGKLVTNSDGASTKINLFFKHNDYENINNNKRKFSISIKRNGSCTITYLAWY